MIQHGDDAGVGVVLVEADVVLALAELVGGAVQQPGNMVHGRADLVADSFVRAERNRGKPDRTGGAEAAPAITGGQRTAETVERDGAPRPAVGTGNVAQWNLDRTRSLAIRYLV